MIMTIVCIKIASEVDLLDFEFLVICTDQFNSGFRKSEFENIAIAERLYRRWDEIA